MEMTDTKPTKIAVLGGGISSLTTIAELTAEPDWQKKYDITVYQMGWRLGGKGASGRNQKLFNRIEEHGYHMWFGFYDNAFRLMRNIYKENARPLEKPMASWKEAFKPVNYWVTAEHVNGEWVAWPLEFRANPMLPGDNLPRPNAAEFAARAIRWMRDLLQSLHQTTSFNVDDDDESSAKYLRSAEPFWKTIYEKLKHEVRAFELGVVERLLYIALTRIEALISGHGDPTQHHSEIVEIIDKFIEKMKARITTDMIANMEARRLWILIDLLSANIKGMIVDGVITKNSFEVINKWDYRDWLQHHGATEFTVKSPLVQGFYALVFCGHYYTYEAGTALRATLELLLNYKGSVYWKMQAGMGDVVFGPIYEVLKKRGIKFKFFHRVKNLKPSADGKTIDTISIGRQVDLNVEEYNPLFNVRGLPCWPSEPFYNQIKQGQQLQDEKINLESFWTPWKDVEELTLTKGVDYDQVVLGISISALPSICGEIISAHQEWKDMIDHVIAVPTMGIQFWMYPDIAGLGSPMWRNEICMVSTYVEPCDTWADKTDVIIRECWPDDYLPNSIAYLTGPMKPDFELPPSSDQNFPNVARDKVKGYAKHFLENHASYLWPHWLAPQTSQQQWQLLVDTKDRTGEDRIDAQYFRANVDPTEHYVLSVTDSTRYRLRADQSGYSNLFLTGDWTRNPINAGCIEAAVMSGMLTALAVQNKPLVIQNEPVGPASLISQGRGAGTL
jgi:uncharacterized protein with NAD-binding domain and iron-sulfur cluster